jgi:hypothetical protein
MGHLFNYSNCNLYFAGIHHFVDAARSSGDVFGKIDKIFQTAKSKDRVLFV